LRLRSRPRFWCNPADLTVTHRWQPGQHVSQIGIGIDAAISATSDDRVNHSTAPPGFFVSDEEPVLFAHGRGSDGVFDEVVVDLDSAIGDEHRQHGLLTESIGEGFAEKAFRKMDSTALEPDESPMDAIQDGATSTAADRFTQRRACPTGAKFLLDPVEMTDLPHDPGGTLFRFFLHEAFVELPPRMRPASRQLDAFALAGVGAIGSVGIALDRAGEVHGDDLFEAFMATTGMPVINWVSRPGRRRPEITLRGLPLARSEILDGCFIDLHVFPPPTKSAAWLPP